MKVLALLLLTAIGYWLAYRTYGQYLARKIFKINAQNVVPSVELADGKEYVSSTKSVMFGHHFTSIAGTGPIVGPAIGVIWGWGPALIWVFFGSIFMGAVHDFSTLIISMRHQGKSISDIAGYYINPRVRFMFFVIVFLALLIVIAIFGLVIALIFARFPQSVVALWLEIPIAIGFGYMALKSGRHIGWWTAFSVLLLYIMIGVGVLFPVTLSGFSWLPATGLWTIILLVYAFIASVLPVDFLLQPRDYLNAWQLYIAMGLILLGIIGTSFMSELTMSAPAFNFFPEGAPSMLPFLFITVACGAISGFHSLVCSGTSSKQIASEADAPLIGYGSMVLEGFLATVIIIAVTAGISLSYQVNGEELTGLAAWQAHYGSWSASAGLGSKLDAVVIGCANLMKVLHIPLDLAIAVVGVFIASFAGTTLDSATRVQRYIIAELVSYTPFKSYNNKWLATTIAVVSAAALAFSSGLDGKGALSLWPLFGAVNQLLGSLALLVATIYLLKLGGKKWLLTGLPCMVLMGITSWASLLNQIHFFQAQQWLLVMINGVILVLSLVMIVEAILVMITGGRVLGTPGRLGRL
ncbi:carbon starvation protein A [Candidatus Marinamargulisbacteria bacterium SCGC AG-410-N11]|nr:carbon starvation protein A [Candidatus Marinamargulisbacteria bacterium SCGC AG-410-N11]